MVRILGTLLLLCTFHQMSYTQVKSLDERAESIPNANCVSVDALASYVKQNFTTDTDRIRAIYVWITHHISYDVVRLKSMEMNPDQPPQAVANVLNIRRAVCQGYSDLFVVLCKSVNINAIVVGGYTKDQGKLSHIAHAWAAASLDGKWYLFDPTWGAGYLKDDKFIKSFNNDI